jgi:hypothetical protein
MGASLAYGTVGATGGGWSAQPGTLQPALDERWAFPKWSWQARAPQTWKDRNSFVSLWPRGQFGMGGNDGSAAYVPIGSDYSGAQGYEPFSCDGEGTQTQNFLRGTTKDSGGTAVANATVQLFRTSDDAYLGQDVSRMDGTYAAPAQAAKATQCYAVAYKAGSPDTAGTTVNTLTLTNIDGTST